MGDIEHVGETLALSERSLAFAAGAIVLAASLLNLLLSNQYPLLTPEVALLFGAVLAAAAIMVPIYAGQRRWGKALLAGLLMFVAVDLNSDSVAAAVVIGLVTSIASWKLGAGLLRFLALMAGVAMLTSSLGLTERIPAISVAKADSRTPVKAGSPPDSQATLPLVVHIILDEMGGLAGLREIDGVRSQFGDEVRATLLEAGFATDALAYTPWVNTIWSVPIALNYGQRPDIEGTVEDGGRMGDVRFLRELRERGYEVNLRQTSYLDFCAANSFDECITSNVNHLRIVHETDLPASDRAAIIGINLVARSIIGRTVSDGLDTALASIGIQKLDGSLPPLLMHRRYVSTLHANQALQRLAEEIRDARAGEAYVAHILLPHYPFAYNSDCSLRRFDHWEPPWGRRPIEERWNRYQQQYGCALRHMLKIAAAVDESPAAKNAVLIVHGDHGPRIRDRAFEDDPTLERTILSTLFAVRRSGASGSVLNRQCPIGTLLAGAMESRKAVEECPRQFYRNSDKGLISEPISDWQAGRPNAGG